MKNPFMCRGCGKAFAGLSLFEKHRTGTYTDQHPSYGRECQTAEQLEAMEWRIKDGVWHGPAVPEDKQWWKK